MEEKQTKKRKAVYNPEADRRWREKNRERVNYLKKRSAARWLMKSGEIEDVLEIYKLALERLNTEGVEVNSHS